MVKNIKPMTAKERLAQSRADLLAAMGYEEVKSGVHDVPKVVQLPRSQGTSSIDHLSAKMSDSVVGHWWRRNPLSSVFQLSEPFLEEYARKHPAKLIAYGAGTGALLWLLKPWKLLSAATVVGLLIKSSDITGLVGDLVSKAKKPDDHFPSLPGSKRS